MVNLDVHRPEIDQQECVEAEDTQTDDEHRGHLAAWEELSVPVIERDLVIKGYGDPGKLDYELELHVGRQNAASDQRSPPRVVRDKRVRLRHLERNQHKLCYNCHGARQDVS